MNIPPNVDLWSWERNDASMVRPELFSKTAMETVDTLEVSDNDYSLLEVRSTDRANPHYRFPKTDFAFDHRLCRRSWHRLSQFDRKLRTSTRCFMEPF